jgi:two-component system LytT family response regulator
MTPIKILIVDDESAACNMLSLLLRKYMPAAHDIVIRQNPAEALSLLPDYQPDLIMLDIEMPEMTGFDFLNRAGTWNFDVIFTTAFDQYAIKAIRFSALDYLLKPLDVLDLQNALNRFLVRHTHINPNRKALMDNLIENVQKTEAEEFRLAISTSEGVFFCLPSEIMRCEGENNYTTFYLENAKPLVVAHTLKDYESILAEYGFMRVHKSHLVNMKQVARIDRDGFIWLHNGDSVPVSRRRKDEVMQLLRR